MGFPFPFVGQCSTPLSKLAAAPMAMEIDRVIKRFIGFAPKGTKGLGAEGTVHLLCLPFGIHLLQGIRRWRRGVRRVF
jgi:hypothetical protein